MYGYNQSLYNKSLHGNNLMDTRKFVTGMKRYNPYMIGIINRNS